MQRTSFALGHSRILLGALALEAVLFSFLAPNFFTVGNFFEITRLSVELGLLAVAMTPVLIAAYTLLYRREFAASFAELNTNVLGICCASEIAPAVLCRNNRTRARPR